MTVRDVTGDPAATAKAILRGRRFTVAQVKRPGPASAPAGTVYAQRPGGHSAGTGQRRDDLCAAVAPPAIVAAPAARPVAQGSAGTFGMRLSVTLASTVTVTVGFTSVTAACR
jgi:hypothetical protein